MCLVQSLVIDDDLNILNLRNAMYIIWSRFFLGEKILATLKRHHI